MDTSLLPKLPKIIALCGRRRSGKDTVADVLCRDYGYTKVRIADPLKKAVQVLFGFDEDTLESDKKDEVHPYWKISPREAMQFMGTEVMQHKVQELLPDVGRKFWIRSLLARLDGSDTSSTDTRYVIPDLRFLHEEEELRRYGAVIWKVMRDDPDFVENQRTDAHSSEVEWKHIREDQYILNRGPITNIADVVPHLLITACSSRSPSLGHTAHGV